MNTRVPPMTTKALYIAKDPQDRSDAVKAVGKGYNFMATEDDDFVRGALQGWQGYGFEAIVVEHPTVLDPYREFIEARGIPVGDLETFLAGKLSPSSRAA